MDKYIDIAWTQTVYEIARTFESQMFRIKNQKRNIYIQHMCKMKIDSIANITVNSLQF